MKITVWSLLSGKASGHIVMTVPETHTIGSVLDKFLTHKGATSSPGYVIRSRDNLVLNPHKTLKAANVQEGETLTVGLSDDEEQTFSFGSWWIVTLVTLLIPAVGLVVILWVFLQPIVPPEKFGLVMDAGSSHSEIFVFSWPGDKPLGTGDVQLRHRCFVAGGINSFAAHEDDLGHYLGKCLTQAEQYVPNYLHKDTPFYVGATAGMRILRDFDPEASVAILATLRDFLVTNSSFRVEHKNIDIIPGFQEGISGWIAVNYLTNSLKQENKKSMAAVDVGGASVQLTSTPVSEGNWTSHSVKLFNHTHRIVSHSFLCYGVGQAQHRYNYLIIAENETKSEGEQSAKEKLFDPCLPSGIAHEVPKSELEGPCTLTGNRKPKFNGMNEIYPKKLRKIFKHFRRAEEQPEEVIELEEGKMKATTKVQDRLPGSWVLHGKGDPEVCERTMERLFDKVLCQNTFSYGDCLSPQSVPEVTEDIVAFSGLFHHLMVLLQVAPDTSLEGYRQAVHRVCALDSTHLFAKYPGVEKGMVEDLCFDGMYVYKLMTAGFGFTNTTWSNIHFIHEVNNTDIEWPLGFMLNQTSTYPSVDGEQPLSLSIFTILVVLFSAFLVSGVLFLRHSIKIRRMSPTYQRVIADHIDQELHKFI